MYRVICEFADLQDNQHVYHVGDIFPHDGKEISEERIKQLMTGANFRGISLIEKVNESKGKAKVEVKAEPEEVNAEEVEVEKPVKPKRKSKNAE